MIFKIILIQLVEDIPSKCEHVGPKKLIRLCSNNIPFKMRTKSVRGVEEVFKRFPLLRDKILEKLDLHSLNISKRASREFFEFTEKGRVLWKRIILRYITGNFYSEHHSLSLIIFFLHQAFGHWPLVIISSN